MHPCSLELAAPAPPSLLVAVASRPFDTSMTQNPPDVAPEPAAEERSAPDGTSMTLAAPTAWGARAAAFRARVLPWIERLPRLAVVLLRVVLALAAAAAVGTYLVLGIIHLRYPFEIEWMEGGMLDEVRRVLDGQKLYVKPTLEFVPFLYAPLYFYVAAAFSKVFGVGFFSARLVSYLASLAATALVARFVHRETGGKLAALIAAGVFTATYHLSAGFYDIARVDSLFVLLLLSALYVLRFRRSVRSGVAAAALFTLALLTKQSASVIFVPVALYVLLAERRRGVAFAAAGAAMMVGSVLVLDRIHDGWFWYFVFWLPRQHPWVSRMWVDFWVDDLMKPLSVSCLFALFYVTIDRRVLSSADAAGLTPGDLADRASPPAVPSVPGRASPLAASFRTGRYFYLFAAAGMLGASWAGRLHSGGWPNVIMPGFAILAILFGLGVHVAIDAAAHLAASLRHRIEALALAAAAVQFACLVYQPSRWTPGLASTPSARSARSRGRSSSRPMATSPRWPASVPTPTRWRSRTSSASAAARPATIFALTSRGRSPSTGSARSSRIPTSSRRRSRAPTVARATSSRTRRCSGP